MEQRVGLPHVHLEAFVQKIIGQIHSPFVADCKADLAKLGREGGSGDPPEPKDYRQSRRGIGGILATKHKRTLLVVPIGTLRIRKKAKDSPNWSVKFRPFLYGAFSQYLSVVIASKRKNWKVKNRGGGGAIAVPPPILWMP